MRRVSPNGYQGAIRGTPQSGNLGSLQEKLHCGNQLRDNDEMKPTSAGLLLFREQSNSLEVLLVHPGGPFWAKKDAGAWFMPKGELGPNEDRLAGARREFHEETGFAPEGPFLPLGSVQQKSGKIIHAWAVRGDWNPAGLRSNTFALEWPPHSGKQVEFPEVDRAAFFNCCEARQKIHPAELPFIQRLHDFVDDATK